MSHNFANEPQPRTFAPSREDVLSNLMYFFGAPVRAAPWTPCRGVDSRRPVVVGR